MRLSRTVPFLALFVSTSLPAATFTVTSVADSGAGSLRQSILDANANPGADTIAFAVPLAGVHVITLLSPLPDVTDPVAIDGYTQPGAVPNSNPYYTNAVLAIELQGSGTDGLKVTSGGSTIQGLAFHGFNVALRLETVGGNVVAGNFIGTDALGAPTSGNAVGVVVDHTSGDEVGGTTPGARNLISGNTVGALGVFVTMLGIDANLIGTTAMGYAANPNGTGVRLVAASTSHVGSPSGGETRNVISGNLGNGIEVESSSDLIIANNAIGVDVTGFARLGNGNHGVRLLNCNSNVQYNVIGGNGVDGINAEDGETRLFANHIGSDPAALGIPLSNGRAGVRFEPGASALGTRAYFAKAPGTFGEYPNVIAFNSVGVWFVAPAYLEYLVVANNSIFENNGLGIVVGEEPAIRPNSPGGSITNFPLLTSVVSAGGSTTIEGIYNGPAGTVARTVTLRFYSSPACKPRPRLFDEGETFLGSTVLNDGSVPLPFSVVLPVALTDERVTVRATTFVSYQPAPKDYVQYEQSSPYSQRLPFSMSPPSGPESGGTPVTIHGTDFHPGAQVSIGAVAPVNVVVVSDTEITADAPALPAGTANDVTVTNTDGTHGTLELGWVADFLDVPPAQPFHDFIVILVSNGVSGGLGGGLYGPSQATLRQQMAVFLLKGKHGLCYTPPPCTGAFTDVPCPSLFADWIEALAAEGITGGCGPTAYCPADPVLRQQMAVFLLKAEHGSAYVPPPCAGVFEDVPCPSSFADWIEQLSGEGITGGCGGGNYCPLSPVTRGQMAVFLTKTFDLN